jgi:hypothetical protein
MTVNTTSPHVRVQRKSGVTSWNETLEVVASSGAGGSTSSTNGIALGGSSDVANPPFQVANKIIKD